MKKNLLRNILLITTPILLTALILLIVLKGLYVSLIFAVILLGWSFYFFKILKDSGPRGKKNLLFSVNAGILLCLYYGLPYIVFVNYFGDSGAISLVVSVYGFWLFFDGIIRAIKTRKNNS